jgi:aryl-alcohol dehydrogenase-like predicted oxidoreductase
MERMTSCAWWKLGSSDLEVSEILGLVVHLRRWRGRAVSEPGTDAAFDVGINFFDTANVYGQGAAESAWGEILAAAPVTPTYWPRRCGERCPTPTGAFPASRSPADRRVAARLRTDYVDLYQAHRFDMDADRGHDRSAAEGRRGG